MRLAFSAGQEFGDYINQLEWRLKVLEAEE
jgi:hypothetical protein